MYSGKSIKLGGIGEKLKKIYVEKIIISFNLSQQELSTKNVFDKFSLKYVKKTNQCILIRLEYLIL